MNDLNKRASDAILELTEVLEGKLMHVQYDIDTTQAIGRACSDCGKWNCEHDDNCAISGYRRLANELKEQDDE